MALALVFLYQKNQDTTDIYIQGILVALAYILTADMAT